MTARVVGVTMAAADGRVLAGGHIDRPRPGDPLDWPVFPVGGWAVGAAGPVAAVEAWLPGGLLRRIAVDEPRPDVAVVFPRHPWADRGGFAGVVHLPSRAGEHPVELRAVTGDGSVAPVGVVRLTVPGPVTPGTGPDPAMAYPIPGSRQIGLLRNLVTNPLVEVGEFTYYAADEGDDAAEFGDRCVLYAHPGIGDRLVIGRFCSLARGVRFVMNAANHGTAGFSTYPFWTFGEWGRVQPAVSDLPHRGDTVVGNDVWVGYEALVLPGVRVGDGAVVGARAVVSRDVPPYAVVAGNPARVVRRRFPDAVVEDLLAIRWWDWPVEKITSNLEAIVGADVAALRAAV
jgi:virginiamycin A acetyltransferase